jgi:hypothetical protein
LHPRTRHTDTRTQQRGIDGYASPAPKNDTAAGLAFLWRTDVWTLAANPIVDWEGRITTIKLLNKVDSQTYVFTNAYLYQSGKDATSKRNLGNALLNQARGRHHSDIYYLMGDLNGQPASLRRNASTDQNTLTYEALLDEGQLRRLNTLAPTYFFSAATTKPTYAVDWLLAKDEALDTTSVKSCNPERKGANATDMTDGRLVLIPVRWLDPSYVHQSKNKSESVFVTLEQADTSDPLELNGRTTPNAERLFRVHPVAESAPAGMVQRVLYLRWGDLYPTNPLTPYREFVRVLGKAFDPFKTYATDELVDLDAADAAAAVPGLPPTRSAATRLAMAQRRLPTSNASTSIDVALANTVGAHMCERTSLGAPIRNGRCPQPGAAQEKSYLTGTYHLSILTTITLLRPNAAAGATTAKKGRLKLHEMPTGAEGWPALETTMVDECIRAVEALAADARNEPAGPTAANANVTHPSIVPTLTSLPTAATSTQPNGTAGRHPLAAAAAQALLDALATSSTASAATTPALQLESLLADIEAIGPTRSLAAVFSATNDAAAAHLGRTKPKQENRHKTVSTDRLKTRLDDLINLRAQAGQRVAELTLKSTRTPSARPNRPTIEYVQTTAHFQNYTRTLGFTPPPVRRLWACPTANARGDALPRPLFQRADPLNVQVCA